MSDIKPFNLSAKLLDGFIPPTLEEGPFACGVDTTGKLFNSSEGAGEESNIL